MKPEPIDMLTSMIKKYAYIITEISVAKDFQIATSMLVEAKGYKIFIDEKTHGNLYNQIENYFIQYEAVKNKELAELEKKLNAIASLMK